MSARMHACVQMHGRAGGWWASMLASTTNVCAGACADSMPGTSDICMHRKMCGWTPTHAWAY
eukprot:358916-Chlamydomonas_euryale.AAC.5